MPGAKVDGYQKVYENRIDMKSIVLPYYNISEEINVFTIRIDWSIDTGLH